MNNNSIWEIQKYPKDFDNLKENIKTDLLIIGAGISGLSVAYEMLPHYSKITIVDQDKIYQGTTASTTAKITIQHGFIYHDLIRLRGEDLAREYYEFNNLGLKRIEEIINKEKIDCDFQLVNGYLYALKQPENDNIDKEYKAYQTLGIESEITSIDSKITNYKALKVENQANFNVSKYLKGITDILLEKGVSIYENTRIVKVYKDIEPVAKTEDFLSIIAKKIIICSHYPTYKGFNFYFTKMMPKMSYSIVSAPTDIKIENANYINTTNNPSVALRYIKYKDQWLLNISGASHSANKFKQTQGQINLLKAFGENHFGITEYPYTWCTQDYTSTDYVPLVGRIKEDIYCATAYNKWGMAAAVAASVIIKDSIIKNTNDFSELLDPTRWTINKKFFQYNVKTIFTLFKTRTIPRSNILKMAPNSGKVVKLGTKRVGIYKDENNFIHAVDATCPHLKCGLRFNPVERTYDCKCHGSRFTYEGKLIDGPSLRDLEKIDIEYIKKYLEE